MPLDGVNIRRVHKMLNYMKTGGATRITDLLGRAIAVTLTKDILVQALQLPITNFPIKAHRAHSDLARLAARGEDGRRGGGHSERDGHAGPPGKRDRRERFRGVLIAPIIRRTA